MKCHMCERQANGKNSVTIENNQVIFFCSPKCVWSYLQRRFHSEGLVFAGRVQE
jgi:ribosomal protein L24E